MRVPLGFYSCYIGVLLGLHFRVILELCWGSIGVILGFFRGYIKVILGFYWGYVRVMLGLY